MSTLLCILDGFGLNENAHGNAVKQANTPTLDKLFSQNPTAKLFTHGSYVGLPDGQMGNSEVGHITIGSGRVILQTLPKINKALKDGSMFKTQEYLDYMQKAENSENIHVLGLVSNGGVHSHVDHILGLVEKLDTVGKKVFIHAITDGRDVAPSSAQQIIADLQASISHLENVELADVIGRFYAMDRDNRIERTDAAYNLYTKPAEVIEDANTMFRKLYNQEIYDEFIPAGKLLANSEIKKGDSLIIANFRADRSRQITKRFIDCDLDLNIATLTELDASFNDDVTVFFAPEDVKNTIGEVVANAGLTQLRTAETEKYAHVTFFMNGGREDTFKNEDRALVPSPQVATYDLQPEMSLEILTKTLQDGVKKGYDLIICNVANGDMVGHTGSMPAAIKAVEAIDKFMENLLPVLEETNSQMIVTADHGNCEEMLDENNKVLTKHSQNPVPICYFGKKELKLKDGSLADLAPTILNLMNLEVPVEMTGKDLTK
jgi:2,3-bisphosphoglycerate-independent phosphoglycerate mutase